MCVACVAQSTVYVGGAVATLQILKARAANLHRSTVEHPDQALGRDDAVGVAADVLDLVPVDTDVEPHTDPAPPADVGRPKETVGLGLGGSEG